MFGLFKEKKLNNYANTIFDVLAPQIGLAKEFGNWPDYTTMCNRMIDNDYLLSYFNSYINIMLKIQYRLESSKDCGIVTMKILEMIEPKFADPIPLQRYLDRLIVASDTPKFKKGAEDAFMTCMVMLDMQEQEKFSKDKTYKEAFNYFDDGEFDADKKITQQLGIKNSSKIGNIPKRFIVAHRIYEMTFGKELASHFKFENPII
jgi:hypothetical protein|tara:strand:- start:1020 stop:1631 length:612 start_codon:yes stop_codon:yes gene_type:complete